MKLKKFNEYIKEDTSSAYDIEKPFTTDGDNMQTQEDESQEGGMPEIEEIEGGAPMMGDEEGEEINMEEELAKLPKAILMKIASGSDECVLVAKALCGIECDDEDMDDMGHEDMDDDDMDDMDVEDMDDMPKLSLEESLKFKNFRKRK